jgi:hypothetical protein
MDAKTLWKTLSDQLVVDARDENHPFSTGKTGFYAGGKVVLDNVRYQVSLSVVKITPKPAK